MERYRCIVSWLLDIQWWRLTKVDLTRPTHNHDVPDYAKVLEAKLDEISFRIRRQKGSNNSDLDSESETDVDDETPKATGDILDQLLTDVECLQELGPALELPSQDSQYQETPRRMADGIFTLTSLPFGESIKHSHPYADIELVERLAEQNVARYIRLHKLRCLNEKEDNSEVLRLDSHTIAPSSKFQDLGFEGSHASSFIEKSRQNFPPLPDVVKQGRPFPCPACGKMVFMENTTLWKDHLISDLQPYVCVFPGCSFSSTQLERASVSDWAAHLKETHAPANRNNGWQCPLCMKDVASSKFVAHVGRRLEDIALKTLPRECESEKDFGDEDSQLQEEQSSSRFHDGAKGYPNLAIELFPQLSDSDNDLVPDGGSRSSSPSLLFPASSASIFEPPDPYALRQAVKVHNALEQVHRSEPNHEAHRYEESSSKLGDAPYSPSSGNSSREGDPIANLASDQSEGTRQRSRLRCRREGCSSTFIFLKDLARHEWSVHEDYGRSKDLSGPAFSRLDSPPPFVPQHCKVRSSRKERPSQGDAVLINFLSNSGKLDLSRVAAERALDCEIEHEESDNSDEEVVGEVISGVLNDGSHSTGVEQANE